jgi:hypothetical protein
LCPHGVAGGALKVTARLQRKLQACGARADAKRLAKLTAG